MVEVHVLRVFCGPDGAHGNPLGVVRDGAAVPGVAARQAVAAALGFSETVFVDDAAHGRVDVYTPSVRLPFAGHPLVGVTWLLAQQGRAPEVLRPGAGDVPARAAGERGEFGWIAGRREWVPERRTVQHASAAEVDALTPPPAGSGWQYAWAWLDEPAGLVRARGFPGRGDGIVEDEATGASALLLTAELGRALDVRQGVGSQLLTRPLPDGMVEVGGRVALVEVRALP